MLSSSGWSFKRAATRPGRLGMAAVGASIVFAITSLGAARAPASVSAFEASASASGFRLLWSLANAPVQQTVVDGGGPTAQSVLDSLGTSASLASFPYPGDLFLAAPGLARGAFGFPAPDYPFVAQAANPQKPEADASFGFSDMKASAQPQEARAQATTGGSGGEAAALARSTSKSSVRLDGEDVVATGESLAEGLVVGPLRLGTVRSVARVVLHPDGRLERSADVGMDNAMVAGAPASFGPDGKLRVVSATHPGPSADPLADAGIEVVQLAKEPSQDGVVSAGLRITRRGDFGPGGPGALSVIVGQASARVHGVATVISDNLGSGSSASSTAEQSDASPSGDASSEALKAASTPPAAEPAVGTGVLSDPGQAPSALSSVDGADLPAPADAQGAKEPTGAAAAGEATFVPARPVTVRAPLPASAYDSLERFDSRSLFVLLILGAVVVTGSVLSVRFAARR